MVSLKPDLVFVTSPNASTKGPTKARELISSSGIPVVVVSDGPKSLIEELQAKGIGCIIVEADSMIGARREFLDPIEMAIFNADTIKVLSVTGVYSLIYKTIDALIEQLKSGKKLELPLLNITREKSLKVSGLSNPYALAKAGASYEMAKRVSTLTTEACFKEKDWAVYTALCATAHELMRTAALVSDEVREIEKYGDNVMRKPHYDDGSYLMKKKLIEKPEKQK
jgi:methylenetetrahydromethanopterin dehydrogenase